MFSNLTHLAFIGPGGPELLVVMLVLLLMFGAKDAPRIFRKLNEMLNQVRNTADSFKREIMYSDLKTETPADIFSDTDEHDEDHVGVDEQDFSDETFRNLEKDLEGTEVEEAAEPEVSADEDADAPKT